MAFRIRPKLNAKRENIVFKQSLSTTEGWVMNYCGANPRIDVSAEKKEKYLKINKANFIRENIRL